MILTHVKTLWNGPASPLAVRVQGTCKNEQTRSQVTGNLRHKVSADHSSVHQDLDMEMDLKVRGRRLLPSDRDQS